MFQNRSGQGGADGVMYRRAKLWQIIMVSTSAFIGMGFYSLIGLANYTASIGYGIATVAVGGILTFTRIFDAITDPIFAFLYDKVNTRFGKVRILMISGWALNGEKQAVRKYREQCQRIQDEDIQKCLKRIILDEELHVEILESLCKKYPI